MLESLFNKVDSKDTKEAPAQVFLANIEKFLRTPSLRNTSGSCFCCFKKLVHFQENISGGGLIHLPF